MTNEAPIPIEAATPDQNRGLNAYKPTSVNAAAMLGRISTPLILGLPSASVTNNPLEIEIPAVESDIKR